MFGGLINPNEYYAKNPFFLLAVPVPLAIFRYYSTKEKITAPPVVRLADSLKNVSLTGLKFRGVGPALMGGRIVDIAVNPI